MVGYSYIIQNKVVLYCVHVVLSISGLPFSYTSEMGLVGQHIVMYQLNPYYLLILHIYNVLI